MSEITIALITIFGTVASVSGVVIYVFNGTKKLIREMHTTIQEMHRESEQRHREVIELLKRGFGDLSKDINGIGRRVSN